MREALTIIGKCFWDSPKQALQDILSLLAIILCFVVVLYAWDIPERPAGIQSAQHQIEVQRHLGVRK